MLLNEKSSGRNRELAAAIQAINNDAAVLGDANNRTKEVDERVRVVFRVSNGDDQLLADERRRIGMEHWVGPSAVWTLLRGLHEVVWLSRLHEKYG
jgi:hypothetical protein